MATVTDNPFPARQPSQWEYVEFRVNDVLDIEKQRLDGWELIGMRKRNGNRIRTAVMRRRRAAALDQQGTVSLG
jgi:hypothetical protein